MATEQFGMVAGIAMVIGSFPTFISHSLMIMLIPTISKENAERNIESLAKITSASHDVDIFIWSSCCCRLLPFC